MRCMSMHLNCVEDTTLPLATLHLRGEAGGQTQSACKSCHRGNKKVSNFIGTWEMNTSLTGGIHSAVRGSTPM